MELFFKPDANSPLNMMLMQHGGSGALYTKNVGGNREVFFRPEERSSTTVSTTALKVQANQWYYYAADTYDGVTATLYVAKSPATGPPLRSARTPPPCSRRSRRKAVHYQPSGSDTLYLGYGDQLGGGSWFRGDMDEVAYYATAR